MFDRPADMIGTRGGKQQSFSLCAPTLLITAQQQLADALGALASAGLTGHQHVNAAPPQSLGQRLHLRRFADAFTTFQADELPV